MTPEEHNACLEFAQAFGWPEWKSTGIKYCLKWNEIAAWMKFSCIPPDTVWCQNMSYSLTEARDRWIVWLLEEAVKLNEGSIVKLEWNARGVGTSLLLALLDTVTQAKQREAGK